MVRLKAVGEVEVQVSRNISIPYGAIKRFRRTRVFTALLKISIPYGAIKRRRRAYPKKNSSQFQFHMVRLKDPEGYFHFWTEKISIPYGAIKSVCWGCRSWYCVFISIPYGAIKSDMSHENIGSMTTFQFHMVRLKAYLHRGARCV